MYSMREKGGCYGFMEQEYAQVAVDMEDHSFIKHIRDHTGLIPRYEKATGNKVSPLDAVFTGDFYSEKVFRFWRSLGFAQLFAWF